jgi:hypothetical protein
MGRALGYGQGQAMLEEIRRAVRQQEHRYTLHAQERMAQRRITDQEVVQILLCPEAEVIEEYPTDKYSPSCLIYGFTDQRRVLHIQANHQGVIVTVYEPVPEEWLDFKQRRRL